MAQNNSEASSQRIQDDSSSNLECPICLQSCVHPVELPCSHIFCYLCIKGVVLQGPSGRCAICRQSIPHNVLTHPRLKDINQLYKDQGQGGNYQWYYEARGGGWWVYDVRTMQELERAFEAKQSTCQVLIAGQMYEIDFAQMIQYRVNNRSLFRRIKRDLGTAEKRGVAGIRLNNQPSGGQTSRSGSSAGTTTTTTSSSRRRASPQVTSVDNQQQQRSGSGAPKDQLEDTGENSGHSDDSSDDNEDEDSCSDHEEGEVDDEDDDDDMDLGEEDADDSESDCADECRDGARAPTRRSDRSNSSSNNQTSPPSTPSGSNGSANCSSSPVDKTGCVHHNHHHHEPTSFDPPSGEWRKLTSSPKPPINDPRKVDETSTGGGRRSRSRQSATPSPSNNSSSGGTAGNVQIGSIHLNSPINNNGSLTCILIGPSLRITIDYNGTTSPDEVL